MIRPLQSKKKLYTRYKANNSSKIVSRTKVRQALNGLSQNRLVALRPRRDAFVTQPSPREAQQVFEARRVVEREIVERFVQNATETHFAELEAHLAAEQRAIDSGNIPLRTARCVSH